jgi:hypothetical protein
VSQVPQGGYKSHVGSYCMKGTNFPDGVNSIGDVITIVKDLANQIPDNSWMLYLLEFFLPGPTEKLVPAELNLTCSFNGNDKFFAYFGGQEQHEFDIVPIVGHSYRRQILIDPGKRVINYSLSDLQAAQSMETFDLKTGEEEGVHNVENIYNVYNLSSLEEIDFVGADHFTGLEWHNRKYDGPYAIRYQAEISMLQYGKPVPAEDPLHVLYSPYNVLKSVKDESEKEIAYPVEFQDIKLMNNCICYTISSPGNSQDGMNCKF